MPVILLFFHSFSFVSLLRDSWSLTLEREREREHGIAEEGRRKKDKG